MRRIGNTPILKEKEIKSLFDNPKKVSSDSFVIFYKNSNERKIAFTVKRKDYKNIVMRNKMKRILKSLFLTNEKIFPDNYNYIFIANKNILNKNFDQLENELFNVITKLK